MNFNLLIVGDKAVGKTTFIKRHITGDFQANYQPTNGASLYSVPLQTNQGKITFNIYDGGFSETEASENFTSPKTGKGPAKVDCAIIMFDLFNKQSFDNVIHYYNWLISMFGQINVIVCGNKSDIKGKRIQKTLITKFLHNTYKHLKLLYFDVSAKSNYNIEKPFLFLIRKLLITEPMTYKELRNCNISFIEVN